MRSVKIMVSAALMNEESLKLEWVGVAKRGPHCAAMALKKLIGA